VIGPLGCVVVVPLVLAAITGLAPAATARCWALLGSLCTLGVGGMALLAFVAAPGADFRLCETWVWSRSFGANLTLGTDALGAAMLALSGLVTTVATIAAWRQDVRPRLYHGAVLVLLAAVNGVFTALDLLVFYVCWEVVLLPMLVLIGVFGGEQRRYAALKFTVYTLAASVPMLAMVVALWGSTPAAGRTVAVAPAVVAAQSVDGGLTLHGLAVQAPTTATGASTVTVPRGFDVRHLALQHEAWANVRWFGVPLATFGFLALLLACLVKLPAVPLHTWLPHAHVQAPTAISVLLAGVLLKLGVYGLYRLAVPLFPSVAAAWSPGLAALGAAGILWGALVALGQRDLKRLVAYASVSHMGFCLLGLGSATASGLVGGLVQAWTHGLGSSLLFLLVGALYDRAHHRRLDGFGGLQAPMPVFGWVLLVACLGGAGLPGLAGFPGEFLVVAGACTAASPLLPWFGVAAAVAVVLAAAYLLAVQRRIAYGPLRHEGQAAFADLDRRERLAMAPLVLLVVVLGIWPRPLVDALRPVADLLLVHLRGGAP
jgi:NADH-quinone oxidoreductase subunit M